MIEAIDTALTPLGRMIRDKIIHQGPMPFHDFMECCLYHPSHGYYCSPGDKIGKGGDFYTSACFTSLFGDTLARQLEEMWVLLGRGPFTIVEYGAGTGLLCRDILGALESNPDMSGGLRYAIIEKSHVMRERQKALLSPNVCWYDHIRDIPGPLTGCILSNEVLDNFSIHRVVMEEELMEVFVGYENGFKELLKPARDELKDYLSSAGMTLPRGKGMEINLEARDWIAGAAEALEKGFVMTIDYGYWARNAADKYRSSDTLCCYYRQQRNFDPYDHIGEQDITAHVNFSDLRRWGLLNGLECCGLTGQASFLRALGLANWVRLAEEKGRAGSGGQGQHAMLINVLLKDMGNKFKILIQQKGLGRPRLSGLMFPEYEV